MKPLKLNSFHKFVSFVLIAVAVISAVSIAAGGWQSDDQTQPESDDIGGKVENVDENKDGGSNADDDPQHPDGTPDVQPDTEPNQPIYLSAITGLAISEEALAQAPKAVTVNPKAPLYALSDSDLAIEFPIEDGSTRMLAYLSGKDVLWKIGALTASRSFISGVSDFFGGIVVCYGNDDKVAYAPWQTDALVLDLSAHTDAYYTENTLYVYTSAGMIEGELSRNPETNLSASPYKEAPYVFADEVCGNTAASTVIIPYGEGYDTQLYYSEKTGRYLYHKSGARKVDMLNGENVAFTNVFILFADATTYEKANGTQLVLDTYGGGKGYYVSAGMLTEFVWRVDESGALRFLTLSGAPLTVNRGNAYIAYYKAAYSSSVKIA